MDLPRGLFPILDQTVSGLSMAKIVEAFVDAEVRPIIFRNRSIPVSDYRRYIQELDAFKEGMEFDYLIHHHLELVEESRAVGVHLTANSPPVNEARKRLGPESLIGYSAHSLSEARQAEIAGADYVILGAIFKTPKGHAGHPLLGLDGLREVCSKIEIPIYAIGGITTENLLQIRQAGAAGFCALRAVYKNDELEHNVTKLNMMWHA